MHLDGVWVVRRVSGVVMGDGWDWESVWFERLRP